VERAFFMPKNLRAEPTPKEIRWITARESANSVESATPTPTIWPSVQTPFGIKLEKKKIDTFGIS
jgi:hypothetical protein